MDVNVNDILEDDVCPKCGKGIMKKALNINKIMNALVIVKEQENNLERVKKESGYDLIIQRINGILSILYDARYSFNENSLEIGAGVLKGTYDMIKGKYKTYYGWLDFQFPIKLLCADNHLEATKEYKISLDEILQTEREKEKADRKKLFIEKDEKKEREQYERLKVKYGGM